MTYYGYRLSVAICYNSREQKTSRHLEIMQISYKRASEFSVFPLVDSGRLLVCCLEAHNELESFGAIGLSVAITSRYKCRMTRLFRPSSSFRLQEPCGPSQISYCSIEYKSSVSHHGLGYYWFWRYARKIKSSGSNNVFCTSLFSTFSLVHAS